MSDSLHIMRAEVPGPTVGKLVPRVKSTAKILYGLYAVLTLTLIVFLLAGKMPLFEAITTAFGTAGTGGFGTADEESHDHSHCPPLEHHPQCR